MKPDSADIAEPVPVWQRVGVCSAEVLERYHHAAISTDGTECLVAEFDDNRYAVWGIDSGRLVWGPVSSGPEFPCLIDWVQAGKLNLDIGKGEKWYRVFGLFTHHPLLESSGVRLDVHRSEPELSLISIETGAVVQRLEFENSSGDWAFASFSDNGATIAVVTPYEVTFFRPKI